MDDRLRTSTRMTRASRWPAPQHRVDDSAQFGAARSLYSLNRKSEVDGRDVLRQRDGITIFWQVAFRDGAPESLHQGSLIELATRKQFASHRVIATARR